MNDLESLIKKLRTRDPKVVITLNPKQSAIRILSGDLAAPMNVAELKKAPHECARQFIRENKPIVGEIDHVKELIDDRAMTNRRGMTHVVFQQKHGYALVMGGTLSLHYAANGEMYLIKSSLASAIENSRLFAATEASLEEIRTLHRQYLEQAWQKETALRGEINYSFESSNITQQQSPSGRTPACRLCCRQRPGRTSAGPSITKTKAWVTPRLPNSPAT